MDNRDFLPQKNYSENKKFEKSRAAQFPSSKRFKEKDAKTVYDSSKSLNPNYDVKYKTVQGFSIAKKHKYKKEIRQKLKKTKIKKIEGLGET